MALASTIREPAALWDELEVGEPVLLRAASPLYRDAYRVEVLGRRSDRLQLSFPMKDGHVVLLPVGTSVAIRRCQDVPGEVWTKLVKRIGGEQRSVLVARPCPETPLVAARPRPTRAPVIALVSGKGGVGTTVTAINVAAALADAGKTVCLVDAVAGVGDADVLMNVHSRWNVSHVVRGERSPFEAAIRGPGRILLLAGGHPEAAEGLGRRRTGELLSRLSPLARYVDGVLVDAGSGTTRYHASLMAQADAVIVVTTPDPHAVTDVYALLHAAARWEGPFAARLVINQADEPAEAAELARRMEFAASCFLGVRLSFLGAIPRDRAVERAVRRQELVVTAAPRSAAGAAMRAIARELLAGGLLGEAAPPQGVARRWLFRRRRGTREEG